MHRVSPRKLVNTCIVNAGSPGSHLHSYLAAFFIRLLAWRLEAVQGPVGSILGALVPLAMQ